jgi:hypothetical protein
MQAKSHTICWISQDRFDYLKADLNSCNEKEKVIKGATTEFETHLSVEKLFIRERRNLFFPLYPLSLSRFHISKTNDSIYPIQARGLLFFPSRRKKGSLVGAYVGATSSTGLNVI